MKRTASEKKGSLAAKLLRLFRAGGGFQEPLRLQEENVSVGVPRNHDYHKEVENALLEAERKKAEALMEWQKRPFIC